MSARSRLLPVVVAAGVVLAAASSAEIGFFEKIGSPLP